MYNVSHYTTAVEAGATIQLKVRQRALGTKPWSCKKNPKSQGWTRAYGLFLLCSLGFHLATISIGETNSFRFFFNWRLVCVRNPPRLRDLGITGAKSEVPNLITSNIGFSHFSCTSRKCVIFLLFFGFRVWLTLFLDVNLTL